MNNPKLIYQSKTLWVNLALAIAAFFPNIQAYISAHPDIFATGFAILNIVLRLVTKSGVQVI